ncbi:hypothetical protein D3C71_2036390 [compost metagenome]
MMQERYDYEHKQGRRKAAQTDEKIGQARPAPNTPRRPKPANNAHLPTTDIEKFVGTYTAPAVGDISEVTKND